jgi:hypothetical protein
MKPPAYKELPQEIQRNQQLKGNNQFFIIPENAVFEKGRNKIKKFMISPVKFRTFYGVKSL